MSAAISYSPALRVGTPTLLFEKTGLGPLQYDAAPGGRRFLILDRPAGEQPLSVHVVQDWFEEFRGAK